MDRSQAKWRKRKLKQGLCQSCGRYKISPKSVRLCKECMAVDRVRRRKATGSRPWRKGGPGRPRK